MKNYFPIVIMTSVSQKISLCEDVCREHSKLIKKFNKLNEQIKKQQAKLDLMLDIRKDLEKDINDLADIINVQKQDIRKMIRKPD